jgi:hypothetical protein
VFLIAMMLLTVADVVLRAVSNSRSAAPSS